MVFTHSVCVQQCKDGQMNMKVKPQLNFYYISCTNCPIGHFSAIYHSANLEVVGGKEDVIRAKKRGILNFYIYKASVASAAKF